MIDIMSADCNGRSPVKVGTISEIHARLKLEGYFVSQTSLRAWVRSGVIPAAYSGNRAYINYDNVVRLLQGGTMRLAGTYDAEGKGIRRIP